MLPLQLTMTAFGPYPGEQSIDFTELGKNPLFLINGPTGSGKTTILDGICYALYGETTGNEREGRDMRCDYAEADTLTEIELIFELSGKTYRVQRMPEQQRPKSRGDGFTTQKAEAKIWRIEDDSEALLASQKIADVNQEIIQLTGLSAQQFRQVMVLPQGKFRELLLAPSEEREKIFKQLFQTHIYTRLQDKLNEQANHLRKDVETQNHQINTLLDALQMESISQLSENIVAQSEHLKTQFLQQQSTEKDWNKAYQALNNGLQLDKLFNDYNQAKTHLNTLQLRQAVMEEQEQALKKAKAAQAIEVIYQAQQRQQKAQRQTEQQLAQQKQQCQSAEQQLQGLREQKQAAGQQAESLDEIKQQLNNLNAYRQRSKDLHQALVDLEQARKSFKQSQQQTKKAEQQHQLQIQKRQKIESDRQQLQNDIAPLADSLLQSEKLQQQQLGLQKYQDLEKQQTALQKKYQKAETTFHKAETELSGQKRQQHLYQQLWQNGQASLLAQQLESDSPCPVCGSLEHPQPAQSESAIPTEAELKQIDEQLEKLNQQRDKAKTRFDQLQNELGSYQQRLQELANEHDVTLDAEQLKQSHNELKEKISWMEQQKTILPSQEQLSQCQQLETQTLEALQNSQNQLNQNQTQLSVCESQVSSCRAELPEQYQDSQKLEKDIKALQKTIVDFEKQLELANSQYQAGEKQLSAVQAQLELVQKQLDVLLSDAELAEQKWTEALQNSLFSSQDEFLEACLKPEQYEQLQTEIKHYYEQVLIAKTALQEKQQQINNQNQPDLDGLKQMEKNTRLAKDEATKIYHQAGNHLKNLQTNFDNIQNIENVKLKLEQDYKVLGYIAQISNGKNPHNLSLQRFVLSVLLDDVLLEAGQRLSQMSKGRYRLLRKETVGDRRTKSGLELEVEDAYTGKLRPVATLSGGESFMAALSLALGLSDVVQAYAGGIRLDTLFVDEGFGSLDPESLDLAINTLIDLQKSGRMVGIISHVPELKERIDVRIDLSLDKKGSKASIYLP